MKLPYLKWFYRDVQADSKLRMCSLEARGCWYEMLWVMAASDRHGYLEHKGEPYTDPMLARLLGTDIDTLYRCKRELLSAGVPSLDGETWFNRRMVADQQRREVGSKFGKKGGGNPALKKEKNQKKEEEEEEPITHISIKGGYIGVDQEEQRIDAKVDWARFKRYKTYFCKLYGRDPDSFLSDIEKRGLIRLLDEIEDKDLKSFNEWMKDKRVTTGKPQMMKNAILNMRDHLDKIKNAGKATKQLDYVP